LAEKYSREGIAIIHSPQHIGKAGVLNLAVRQAEGELIVFADARQELSSGAVRELAAYFADASVGAVSGELVLVDGSHKPSCDGGGLYWRYEKRIRSMESDIHSMVGASGALYAIRRDLFTPLPDDTILDDVLIPMRIVMAGKRVVFAPEAVAIDRADPSPLVEFNRKVRTLFGNYQLLCQLPAVLRPFRNPVFLQFISHKVGRLLAPYFLVLLFVTNLFLLEGLYAVTLALQIAWYLMAIAGMCFHLLPDTGQNTHELDEEQRECA
jgi:cellulose synthase/poly-beta-1,6-N-acetylglucosamine synthase-like glycosyltransferase